MVQLSDYQMDTLALLRDSAGQFTNSTNLIRYINKARREIAKRSACLQALVTGQSPFGTTSQPGNAIPGAMVPGMLPGTAANNANGPGAAATASNSFVTIPGVELYSYQYAKPFLQAQYAGYNSVIYVSNVSVSWSSNRPTLTFLPWNDMQAYCRSYNLGVSSYPTVWSQKGMGESGQIWLFPNPINTSYAEQEWECICTPKPLYTNSDFEALPELYQGCVPYYSAFLAYLGQQRTGMAAIMEGKFQEQLLIDGIAGDWGHFGDYYG